MMSKSKDSTKGLLSEWIGAMAMSEPDAGTDVLGLSTSACNNRWFFETQW